MLVIKMFSEIKKVFREGKKCEKINAKRSDFLQGVNQYLSAGNLSGHLLAVLAKPPSLQKPAPSKTQALVASSQKAAQSSVLASNLMSPPADAFVVKPQSFQVE
nr:hypothetical protein [Tanacetum cinerariifolium]